MIPCAKGMSTNTDPVSLATNMDFNANKRDQQEVQRNSFSCLVGFDPNHLLTAQVFSVDFIVHIFHFTKKKT